MTDNENAFNNVHVAYVRVHVAYVRADEPCPFCANFDRLLVVKDKLVVTEGLEAYAVCCFNGCGAIGPWRSTLVEAVVAWENQVQYKSLWSSILISIPIAMAVFAGVVAFIVSL